MTSTVVHATADGSYAAWAISFFINGVINNDDYYNGQRLFSVYMQLCTVEWNRLIASVNFYTAV